MIVSKHREHVARSLWSQAPLPGNGRYMSELAVRASTRTRRRTAGNGRCLPDGDRQHAARCFGSPSCYPCDAFRSTASIRRVNSLVSSRPLPSREHQFWSSGYTWLTARARLGGRGVTGFNKAGSHPACAPTKWKPHAKQDWLRSEHRKARTSQRTDRRGGDDRTKYAASSSTPDRSRIRSTRG